MFCSICLDVLRRPVATPCGHIFCKECLVSSCRNSRDAKVAPCPTCREDVSLVSPNCMFVPEKYRQFIDSGVRRIYLDNSAETALQKQVAQLQARVTSLETEKDLLMERCESYMQASSRHAENEKDVRTRCTALQKELKKAHQSVAKLVDSLEARQTPAIVHEIKSNDASRPTLKDDANTSVSSHSTSPSHHAKRENSSPTSKSAPLDVVNRQVVPLPKRRRVNPILLPSIQELMVKGT